MEHTGGGAAPPDGDPAASGGSNAADGAAAPVGDGRGGGAAGELWRAVRHDAARLPEHLAVLAVQQEAGPAAKAVAGLSGTGAGAETGAGAGVGTETGAGAGAEAGVKVGEGAEGAEAGGGAGSVAERRTAVITHGIRLTLVEGCVVGGPLILLVPVAFCAGMLAQARMVLELAALAGADGDRTERSAELLVLQGVYPTVPDARAALAATAEADAAAEAEPEGGPPTRPSRLDMIRRMVYLLGLVAIGEDHRGPVRRIAGWVGTGLLVVVGLAFPVVWIPVMGRANVRATTALARRATAFYWPEEARAAGAADGTGTGAGAQGEEAYARTATIAVLGQTLLALLLPVAAFLFVLFLGLDLAGGHLATALLIALAAGAAYAADRARRARGARSPRSPRGPRGSRASGGGRGGAAG
ncbi:hypothetical protein OU787_31435 [Kitasatospora sp. YST-16]|uniref:hypothetical protein n=1 Tax=Kitasatospora sp. YST-16 TaxID=2998080 RepID=UPI0022846B51|nr:hypothetical protein [Kitasatospora sp. YST-16]WAL75652.1 hypothetical protein OU787_31435 [Kitasatospora sp. YST-16]